MRRRALLASLAAGYMLGTGLARARDPVTVHRLGMFLPIIGGCAPLRPGVVTSLLKGVAEAGYVEGRNLKVELRCFGMEPTDTRLAAAELVHLGHDAIFTVGTSYTKDLQEATKTIPIVTNVGDPVLGGFTESLARPRGNITGLSQTHPDTPAKQIELLGRVVPGIARIVLMDDVLYPWARQHKRPYEAAARAAGLVAEVRIVDRSELQSAFIQMKPDKATAAIVTFGDKNLLAELAGLAIRHRLPTLYNDTGYVEQGGLMSFTMRHGNADRTVAAILHKLFRGSTPAQIPWELPDRAHFAINRRTANAIGLTVPPDLLLRADEVTE